MYKIKFHGHRIIRFHRSVISQSIKYVAKFLITLMSEYI